MNILITFFSQTENTLKVAKAMERGFYKSGASVKCLPINEVKSSDVLSYDLIGFGSPTFESHAPTPIKTFIKSLSQLEGKKTFLFATGGGAGGNVLSDMKRLLKRKKTEIVDSFYTLGEVYHPAPALTGASHGRPNKDDLAYAEEFAVSVLGQVRGSRTESYSGLKPKKGFYNVIGAVASWDKFVQLVQPKPKLNSKKCKKCKKCIKECPMNDIQVDDYPVVGNRCVRCYRCMNICSQRAFSVNWWYGNPVAFMLWNQRFLSWFGEYKN